MLYSATDAGALFTDGFGDGIWLESSHNDNDTINRTAFGILQAARTRISKTEYISCPSCGRTLFDLQETTALIRNRTTHLKGVKIGIMGCIVNGPGESKYANIGISLPGTGEEPAAPVFIDGKKEMTLRGPGIAEEFHGIVDDYVDRHYARKRVDA